MDTPVEVNYSGQDFDVHGLVGRLNRGDILIPRFGNNRDDIETEGFQRGFVWKKTQQDRFIESILLGYPIPNIFLVKQADEALLVLDGQQRLLTLQQFYSGKTFAGRRFLLANVSEEFRGRTYQDLNTRLRRKLDNALIQAIVLSTGSSEVDHRAIYQIFERLNAGGTQLTAHEIRIASYPGKLVDYIEILNSDPNWRSLYGPRSPRLRDHELVTRILAMYLDWKHYSRPLKNFLNDFMEAGLSKEVSEAAALFTDAARLINNVQEMGKGPTKRSALKLQSNQTNNSWSDALFIGVMTGLSEGTVTLGSIIKGVAELRSSEEFIGAATGPTSDEKHVTKRMQLAVKAFT
ncbi:hypothetical protein CPHO_08995 [Corynebacterium phocae]|uniref:GmrSD restriction endonucleases N-terminal domain-containing protein n=1 Tax=Corynebacterium phocae TaxID=161895 RepID=A0A1L7D6N7_9CORY|nr:hypothetical protein CPHO_08995 [Corynebacterium phocae]